MATDISGMQYMPQMPDVKAGISSISTAIGQNMTKLYILVFVCVLLYMFYKMSHYRIQIDKLMPVQGGYVHTSGRYRLIYDKDSQRPCFAAMFGKEKLPPYDSKYYQKVQGGLPFISPIHTLTLVFINKYSPVICDSDGILQYVDNKRWLYDMQKAEFLKKFNRANAAYFLAIYAPLMVILGALVFWIVVILLQINVIEQFSTYLGDMVNRLGR
jgi:hypothetical protein